MTRRDPLERKVEQALTAAGIPFSTPDERRDPTGLDFRLPHGVEIEVTFAFTERKIRQCASARDVILLQGPKAVSLFCALLESHQGDRA
jgi:hypothetical protein